MGKRTYFFGFVTVTVLICLLAFACGKKQDADKPAKPGDSNTSAKSDSLPSQEVGSAGRITAKLEAGRETPEQAKGEADEPTPAGLITAIAYSDRPSVLVGEELLYEGDSTGGVKVVKISRTTVEFEKNGTRWTQEAGETPGSYWAETN